MSATVFKKSEINVCVSRSETNVHRCFPYKYEETSKWFLRTAFFLMQNGKEGFYDGQNISFDVTAWL